MDKQTQPSCAPCCIVEMLKLPLITPCSHGSAVGKELGCGIPLAELADIMALLTSPTPPGVAHTQSSLPAPGSAAGAVSQAQGLNMYRVVSPAFRDMPPASKPDMVPICSLAW